MAKENNKTQASGTEDEILTKIAYAKVFPPIGIARVGNSLDENGFFVAPEWPGQRHSTDPLFTYKDSKGKIKRQAARFRVYGFDAAGNAIVELTAENAKLEWTIALANHKPAWFEYNGTVAALEQQKLYGNQDHGDGKKYPYRNGEVGFEKSGSFDERERKRRLQINGGTKKIQGENITPDSHPNGPDNAIFKGSFLETVEVYLGEVRTDSKGRLLVLGGRGHSAGYDADGKVDEGNWIDNYANNDYWHDDVSDGPVSVKVEIDGKEIKVKGNARVVVAPPDYAPDVTNIVTLWDAMEDAAVDHKLDWAELKNAKPDGKTIFWRDIYPILCRLREYTWTNSLALRGHGHNKSGEFFAEEKIATLADPASGEGQRTRAAIVGMVRIPHEMATKEQQLAQANARFMPPLNGDEGDRIDGVPETWLSLTKLQYKHLLNWRDGNFEPGEKHTESGNEPREIKNRPLALTRSILERCVGGAFFPGIEITAIVRLKEVYDEAFRLKSTIGPGHISRYMACPWQADFFECNTSWWPAQRPDEALHEQTLKEAVESFTAEQDGDKFLRVLFSRKPWARGIQTARPDYDSLQGKYTFKPEEKESLDDYFERVCSGIADTWSEIAGLGRGNPWRIQFLRQEQLDRYAYRYVQLTFLSPEDFVDERLKDDGHTSEKKRQICKDLRHNWPQVPAPLKMTATELISKYQEMAEAHLLKQIKSLLKPFYAKSRGKKDEAKELYELLGAADDRNSIEVERESILFSQAAFEELTQGCADYLYQDAIQTAGDNGMVQEWSRLGFITQKDLKWNDKHPTTVFVESDSEPMDGMEYRDYFYRLMNLSDYPEIYDYSINIVEKVLESTRILIESMAVDDDGIIEQAFKYSPETFNARLEAIYEYYRAQGVSYQPWRSRRTREEYISWGILSSAVFNQVDGGWLRFNADAGPMDEIESLLFEIWSDEVGNGNPALHHGNLYTNLLKSLGIYLPDINSKEYAESKLLRDEWYLSPVFQLAISQNSKKYFAEILGMTLYLEWEVLDLVSGVKLWEMLNIDPEFLRMHVGIDNATEGHGHKARKAVEMYLDRARATGGDEAVQKEWNRIWCGFVAFATVENSYLPNDSEIQERRPAHVLTRLGELVERKAHYARLNHGDKKMGGNRLNDLFDNPTVLLRNLAQSQWVVPGKPEESQFLTHLTSFNGPMYKVFDKDELDLWKEWIIWLGREGDTDFRREYFDKEASMSELLKSLAATAASVEGHDRHNMAAKKPDGVPLQGMPLSEWFSKINKGESTKDFMLALRDSDNGFVKPYRPERSNLVVEYLKVQRPMGRALDRRFANLNKQVGRRIIVDWIGAGCPVDGVPVSGQKQTLKPKMPKKSLVQIYGKGSVH